MLSDSEDNDDLHQITVNEHYAKAFQYRKEREELDKLKAKLGSDISESDLENEEGTDSESDESEDEDGEELTMAVDAAILRTLARIKRKDPSIYESGKNVFGEEQEKLAAKTTFIAPSKNKKDTAKPVTMRQVALEAQLNPSRSPSPTPVTHAEEQAALRKEAISAFHTAVNDDTGVADGDENDNDLLILREKTKDEREQEEEEYRAFLEREVGDLQEIIGIEEEDVVGEQAGVNEEAGKKKKKAGKEDKSTKNKKRTTKEEEDQEFLMSYILNRGWIDKSKNHIPTYNEITSKKKSSKRNNASQADFEELNAFDDDDNESDSSFDSLMDHFESSYNHRFEEPGSSTIPSYPRTISTLVRREDTKRKEARERKKSRRQEELEKKKEEVRRLKALKMREIRRKLEKVGIEGGLIKSTKSKGKEKKSKVEGDWDEANGDGDEDVEMDDALKELDLEGDWDPEKHDQQMAGLFAEHDGYDEGGEGDYWEDVGQVDEDGKPVWEDDIDIGDIFVPNDDPVPAPSTSKKDKKKKKKKKKDGVELVNTGVDVDVMDADVQPQGAGDDDEEEWDGTEEMRKRKLDEYMEEIYNLDFNDMVGDLPTRFNYVPVAKQAYALSPTEILYATNKELNEFMSIKRYAPYKMDARKWDTERQRKLHELRATLKEREKTGGWLIKDSDKSNDDGNGEGRRWQPGEEGKPAKKRKGKKERMKARAATATMGEDGDDNNAEPNSRDDATKTEGHDSCGANAEIKTSTKSKRKETGHKRKREDRDQGGANAEVNMESVSGGADSASQEQKKQDRGKEKSEDTEKKGDGSDDGKPKKKRRRKHKKSGEDVAD